MSVTNKELAIAMLESELQSKERLLTQLIGSNSPIERRFKLVLDIRVLRNKIMLAKAYN